jgi:hypothetical protein
MHLGAFEQFSNLPDGQQPIILFHLTHLPIQLHQQPIALPVIDLITAAVLIVILVVVIVLAIIAVLVIISIHPAIAFVVRKQFLPFQLSLHQFHLRIHIGEHPITRP